MDAKLELAKDFIEVNDIPVGVPEGFHANEFLVDLNKTKGWIPPAVKEKGYPINLECWGCEEPLILCGYPHYICENKHYLNRETGAKWHWKGYDEEYHGLLHILQVRVEPKFQKQFFGCSRAKENRDSSLVSSYLSRVGKNLVEITGLKLPDPYFWGKRTIEHHAGLRFAINVMTLLLNNLKLNANLEIGDFDKYDLVSKKETLLRRLVFHPSKILEDLYEKTEEKAFLKLFGEARVATFLKSVEAAKTKLPKETVQINLF